MSVRLKLNARFSSTEKPRIIELSNVNLKSKVEELKKEVTKKVNVDQEKYELIYCGCVMENETTLESCGLKSGVTVHMITKKEQPNVPVQNQFSEQAIMSLASIFNVLRESESFRNAHLRVIEMVFSGNREEFNINLIEAIPGLKSDLVSLAIVNDPFLMLHFTDPETIKRAAKLHPHLVEAAQYVAAAIQEEARKNPIVPANPIAGSSTMTFDPNMSFNIDNTNDIEDMDSSQSSEPSTPHSENPVNSSGITISQLAAALASARSNPAGPTAASSSSRPTNSNRITSERFLQALQQAFESTNSANSTGVSVSPMTPVSPAIPPNSSSSQNMQTQLNLMHEMGLLDDAINIQALHFTNGDVQAAIELVFSGFGDN